MYVMHFISGSVEGNGARAVMWEGYQLERTSIPSWSHYKDGTKLQLEDVLSQVIDIISHSLGPLSSALSTADWLFQNTKECTPVSATTTLSEAFGIEGFTISISWSWIWKQWRVQQGQCHGIPSRWMGDTRCWKQASGDNPTCHCVLQTLLSYFQE